MRKETTEELLEQITHSKDEDVPHLDLNDCKQHFDRALLISVYNLLKEKLIYFEVLAIFASTRNQKQTLPNK